MKIEESTLGNATVLTLIGDFDSRNAKEFEDLLSGLFEQGKCNIVVDLTEVGYMDSSGSAGLVYGMQACGRNNGAFRVVSNNSFVDGLLDGLKLHRVMEIYNNVDDAVKSVVETE